MPNRRRAGAPRPAPRPRSANARVSSPSNRSSFTAPWASPRSSTSAPTSSGCSPSTPCSAAAPTTIAAMPRLAGWQRLETECARAGVPSVNVMGVKMVGPVIIGFGSPEQKNFYLPRILSGEDYWCQGYSEPGSGSDLASLKTRAVRDGDHYIVNGTKIWTTHAHFASQMFALVRTSDTPKRQEGISFLLIDMKTKGISTRPILTIGGDHEVNQVFFDDVRVPVENRVGEENKGWTYAKYLLEFERGAGFRATGLRRQIRELKELLSGRDDDEDKFNERMSGIEIDVDALEMMELKLLSDVQHGRNPG